MGRQARACADGCPASAVRYGPPPAPVQQAAALAFSEPPEIQNGYPGTGPCTRSSPAPWPISGRDLAEEQDPDDDDGKHEGNGDGSLDGQAPLVLNVGLDLVVVIRPRQHLGQVGIATLPVFSVLSQRASAPLSSLYRAQRKIAHSSGP